MGVMMMYSIIMNNNNFLNYLYSNVYSISNTNLV